MSEEREPYDAEPRANTFVAESVNVGQPLPVISAETMAVLRRALDAYNDLCNARLHGEDDAAAEAAYAEAVKTLRAYDEGPAYIEVGAERQDGPYLEAKAEPFDAGALIAQAGVAAYAQQQLAAYTNAVTAELAKLAERVAALEEQDRQQREINDAFDERLQAVEDCVDAMEEDV